jgi:hypothetical protein
MCIQIDYRSFSPFHSDSLRLISIQDPWPASWISIRGDEIVVLKRSKPSLGPFHKFVHGCFGLFFEGWVAFAPSSRYKMGSE